MKISNQILLGFSIVILLSIVDSYINYMLSMKVKQNTEFLVKSESIIRNSSRLHKSIIEMQSSFRGFLLTDDTNFLAIFNNGRVEIPNLVTEQRALIINDRLKRSKLDSIFLIHQEWIVYANALINAKLRYLDSETSRQEYMDLFENKLKKQVGKRLNDKIAVIFTEFDREEYKIRESRRDALSQSITMTHTYSILFISLTIIIGLISTVFIINKISKRISSMVGLAQDISRGEFGQVHDSGKDELTDLSHSLNVMSQKLETNIVELERKNKELDEFAYVVSHDLKAPLRGINNVVRWIEEDMGHQLTPELKQQIDIIPRRTRRMEDLINGLLDYARIRERTKLEIVDTNALIRDITDLIVPREIHVTTNNLPQLYSEKIKLEQVFSNLISNSVKYMGSENGRIAISCRQNADHYEFTVRDNGIGIDPEYHDKIFGIFQTLRDRNAIESTGIGLAITKKIITDRQGTIRVKSLPGKGASFIFTWPKQEVISE